jgi:hypothetical protein
MKRIASSLVVAGLLAACSSTPTVIPTKNLDRPTDMGLVCLGLVTDGVTGQTALSGRPMETCHPRGEVDPATTTDGHRTLGTFAFLPNAGRGELAVADLDRGRLLDLGPQSPGYGMLPLGGGPETLAASPDGCFVATANRTSCDFSLVDPARLLAPTFSDSSSTVSAATGEGQASRHLLVQTAAGRVLRTAVGEIAFLPGPSPAPLCQADAVRRAVATFPGCDLVALLDLSFAEGTAKVTSAYYVLSGGPQDAGAEPVCPDDCPASPGSGSPPDVADGAAADPDGGASLDGGVRISPLQVQALALLPDGTRVYVGGRLDTGITSFDISDGVLGAPVRIELAENPGGISRLRLNVDPFLTTPVARPDGTMGKLGFLDARGSFLYAFAADDSIRVLNLDAPSPVECDVNILVPPDREAAEKAKPCFPVGTPGRRPLAQGPGIRIPTFSNPDTPPPLPRDIAFAEFQPTAGNANYHALSGQFGFVLASSGQVYVLNLAPSYEDGATPPPSSSCTTYLPADAAALPAAATHSFREAREVGQCARAPAAVSIAPQRQATQTDQAFATAVNFSALEGPRIQPFSDDGGTTTSWFDFPDGDTIVSRGWDVVWEGTLPGTARASGIVRNASETGTAGSFTDAGGSFCGSGVEPGDIVMISGCTQNSDCQPDNEFSCQISVSGARGMCLPIDSSASEALLARCGRLMGSRMRYEVARVEPTRLTLRLKLDEVPKTTLNPCTQDSDCRPDREHGSLPTDRPDGGGGRQPFQCVEVRPQERRCVQPCSPGADNECRPGHVCETVPWTSPPRSLCVQAPPVDEGCFPQPMTSYSVRAGHGYVVYGSSLPSPHNGSVASDGTCAYGTAASTTFVNRIPLSAPQCPESLFTQNGTTAGPALVQTLPAQAGVNPCLYRGARNDGTGTDVAAANPGGTDPVRAFFQNPQIRFVLTNLDTYAGDLLAIHFELQHGFAPLTVQIPSYEVLLTLGTRILTGPTKTPESPVRRSGEAITYPYLYVVDQGRTAITPGSRGQVLRINPRAGSNEIATFDTTMSGSTPFHLQ